MLLGEIIRVRLQHSLCHLVPLALLLLGIPASHLFFDLTLKVYLLLSEVLLTHECSVENGRFLLQAGLQETLAHLVYDVIHTHVIHAVELDPFSKEAWSEFDSILEVEAIVLSPTEDSQQELTHAHLLAASVLEESHYDQNREHVEQNDDHGHPIVAFIEAKYDQTQNQEGARPQN